MKLTPEQRRNVRAAQRRLERRLERVVNEVVYFIQEVGSGHVKIGLSQTPKLRLRELQTASPYELRLVGYIPAGDRCLERQLHAAFSDYRLQGEWFRLSPRLVSFVCQNAVIVSGFLK